MLAVTVMDLAMAGTIFLGFLLLMALAIWGVLRHANKVGPLAAAQQAHEIEEYRVKSVLAGKRAEAEIARADAAIIEAQASVIEMRNKAQAALEKGLEK